MFEISGDDISCLSDDDLRTLVAHLARAEVRARRLPVSSVIAGGNQDAPDGGIDVRVECPSDSPPLDFIPRAQTGFQVKKPDMPAGAILAEMRPNNALRKTIRALAEASGSYVIVSAKGSLTYSALADRRKAMREALDDLPGAERLHTDFYDRDRLAVWVNEYPGIVNWARSRVGRPLCGWSEVGNWEGSTKRKSDPYLFNETACLIDKSSQETKNLTVQEGIARLRTALDTPGTCVRLVGLSGVGKTRLVEALFESGIGEVSLDPGIAVYTDYSSETVPSARDMARDLKMHGQRAILIVDNCKPSVHNELAQFCSDISGKISLLTVEYDVQDDEPEQTSVFRLESASPDLVTEWLKQKFPDISQIDREKIAQFSDGNFRIARALSETLGKGETLGRIKSQELFVRLFQQRNEPDPQLLQNAEDLSLLYSIDGENTNEEGELRVVGAIRNIEASSLFSALVEMKRREQVQSRGRFRAILPQAIANRLAVRALERIPPSDFDRFSACLPERMLKSVARRLGFLHDSPVVKAVVERWLQHDGPLGDLVSLGEIGLVILANIAPVSPEAVLTRIQRDLDGSDGGRLLSPENRFRHHWLRLIKSLAYDGAMFNAAAMLLARFLAAEQSGVKCHSAGEAFNELFHLYLSGTQAPPSQRRAFIEQLASSANPSLRNCASSAIDASLVARHITSLGSFDFGARSRDWGWQPTFASDEYDWYDEAIDLAVKFAPQLPDLRTILAKHVCELWRYPACHDALDRATAAFAANGPWIDGWIAFRAVRRSSDDDMPDELRQKLEQIIERIKPPDLLNRARAVILTTSHGDDFIDGEEDQDDHGLAWERAMGTAQKVGQLLAKDRDVRAEFIAELLVSRALRAFACGRGLAEGADDVGAMWQELIAACKAAKVKAPDVGVLCGFLHEANRLDPAFTAAALEAVIHNPDMARHLPDLQVQIGIDEQGVDRLRRAIARGVLAASNFYRLASGSIKETRPETLEGLLRDLAALADGVEMAIDILHMYFYANEEGQQDVQLLTLGRNLLARIDFSKKGVMRDHSIQELICICFAGEPGKVTAHEVCMKLRTDIDGISFYDLGHILDVLFKTQPLIALDTFLLSDPAYSPERFFNATRGERTPIENLSVSTLKQWADQDPNPRYPALGRCIGMFVRKNHEEVGELSHIFLEILTHAPDKREFLGNYWDRLRPRGWSGSLADVLLIRKGLVAKLAELEDEQVRGWASDMVLELDCRIGDARKRDRDREESFE